MTIEELKDYLIERGIESVEKTESGSNKLGGIEGFEMCRALCTPQDFEDKINELNRQSQGISRRRHDLIKEEEEQYWRIRCQCLQVEFVYERLKCAWGSEILSARAVLDYSQILEEEYENL